MKEKKPVAIQLKVAESKQRDVGKGRARIDIDSMGVLKVGPGDVVEVIGKKNTSATVWPADPEDQNLEVIRIDGQTRKNAGVALNVPTVGVAKSLLYGDVEDNNIVTINEERRGFAFVSSKRVKRPVYVSPGHMVSFDTSIKVVKNLSSFRVPEPLRLAHLLARKKISN